MPKGTLQFSFHYLLTNLLLVRKYILSLDGGGFRGLSSLIILNHIMRMLVDDPDDEPVPSPCQIFDLICGASTGGIIAILLGRLGLDCSTAISIYQELGPRVFGKEKGKMWSHISILWIG
jgi:patatin-like phospholipase/acyl hydrolase